MILNRSNCKYSDRTHNSLSFYSIEKVLFCSTALSEEYSSEARKMSEEERASSSDGLSCFYCGTVLEREGRREEFSLRNMFECRLFEEETFSCFV